MNYGMKDNCVSAYLIVITYGIMLYDLRESSITQVLLDGISEGPDLSFADPSSFFIRKFSPRLTFWYIACLNRSKNNKVMALHVG